MKHDHIDNQLHLGNHFNVAYHERCEYDLQFESQKICLQLSDAATRRLPPRLDAGRDIFTNIVPQYLHFKND
jgi:hypothetical protein